MLPTSSSASRQKVRQNRFSPTGERAVLRRSYSRGTGLVASGGGWWKALMNSNAEITGPEGTPNMGNTGYGLSKKCLSTGGC